MMNFENTIKRRCKINDFNVDKNNDIYINDILFEPILSDSIKSSSSPAEALYNMFYAGDKIQVNYYCPTDGRNFPKKFSMHYIEDKDCVEFERV